MITIASMIQISGNGTPSWRCKVPAPTVRMPNRNAVSGTQSGLSCASSATAIAVMPMPGAKFSSSR